MRADGRKADELRPVTITPHFTPHAEGSVLISIGSTKVLCNLTIEEGVPRWMQTQGVAGGWITAEYAMLPRSTQTRTPRETGSLGGRTQEIRRLIGRCLRSTVHLGLLGPRTCTLDCDVLQADGGTRTAAITGGYMALAIGLQRLIRTGLVSQDVLRAPVAAVSVGVVKGQPMLDLNYSEDSQAEVDANIVMNGRGEFIEIQSSAERSAFDRAVFEQLLGLAYQGIGDLLSMQSRLLSELRQTG